jgi:hypothetical protein
MINAFEQVIPSPNPPSGHRHGGYSQMMSVHDGFVERYFGGTQRFNFLGDVSNTTAPLMSLYKGIIAPVHHTSSPVPP